MVSRAPSSAGNRLAGALVAAACLASLAACSDSLSQAAKAADAGQTASDGRVARLTIKIDPSSLPASRTLSPAGHDFAVASYAIVGAGPSTGASNASFALTVPPDAASVSPILPGAWTVSVSARNAQGLELGTGAGAVTIAAEEEASLQIQVRPLSGEGTLRVLLSWPAAIIPNPRLYALVAPVSGDARDLAAGFTVSTGPGGLAKTAELAASLPAGSWSATFKISDASFTEATWSWGLSEALCIVQGETTQGNYALDASILNRPPEPPSATAFDLVSKSRMRIRWTDNSVVEGGYLVERSDGGAFLPIGGTLAENATSYTDETVVAGGTYRYQVRAVDSWGYSAYCAPVEAYAGTLWAGASPDPRDATWDVNCWE